MTAPLRQRLLTWRNLLVLVVWGLVLKLSGEWAPIVLIASAIAFMFWNTRGGDDDDGPSAYTIFNEDFRPMPGQLTAAQIDAGLRHRHAEEPMQGVVAGNGGVEAERGGGPRAFARGGAGTRLGTAAGAGARDVGGGAAGSGFTDTAGEEEDRELQAALQASLSDQGGSAGRAGEHGGADRDHAAHERRRVRAAAADRRAGAK